jgi:hypothetical protein
MKMNILGCDWCDPRRPKPAITTRTLVNGKLRPDDPHLDLCRIHNREVEMVFRPRKRKARSSQPQVRRPRASSWQESDWQRAEQRLLRALKPGGLMGTALIKASGVPRHRIYQLATRLLKAKRIVRVPGKRKGFQLANAGAGA